MQTNNFRSFDQLRTSELQVIRHGWFNANYELTDGQFSYGIITFRYLSRRYSTVETANGNWQFEKAFFSRMLNIRKAGGELIGSVRQEYFCRLNELRLNSGFNAVFKRTGFFPTEFTWSSDQHGEILRVKQRWFAFTNPLIVTLNPTIKIPEINLLAFLGIHILLLRHRRKGAAH